MGLPRKVTATAAAALVLAGSAALAAPAAHAADTHYAKCGGSVTAKPGDKVVAQTLLGPLDLGIVNAATTLLSGVLGTLCKVTVTVVDTVVAPIPVVGGPAADAVNGTVSGLTGAAGQALNPGQQQPAPGTKPPAQNPGQQPGNPGTQPQQPLIPGPNSPVLGGSAPTFAGLPTNFSTGFSPMRDYSNIPMATAGLFSPSPGVRYGGQVPGYAPEFGILGQDQPKPDDGVRNAGSAEAVAAPAGSGGGVGLPTLIAVLALSGVTAGLVRTWVLRRVPTA
ncbi:hypothetical protein [Amycolatopsis suaedae]|uniref:DUF320 domain-containing protein n=1 Tax=Amycolatopsis suaedae TaxID=2510978 RepID=A0A4Q7JDB5_9PSEU|nr:hypothetical protein [Amycolatopsis suaedae]RZQ65062.1 hypothetical protein EWH70_03940 [Amycolatopsis suaedae]